MRVFVRLAPGYIDPYERFWIHDPAAFFRDLPTRSDAATGNAHRLSAVERVERHLRHGPAAFFRDLPTRSDAATGSARRLSVAGRAD